MSRTITCWATILLISSASADDGPADPLAYQPQPQPHVLVDQTHDYLFLVYHLAYFLHEQGMLGAHSDRTLTWDLIKNCDVVVTHQGAGDVPYTGQEIEALERFVRGGGGLLLIGNNVAHTRMAERRKERGLMEASADLPLNTLAAQFGLRFNDAPARQPFAIQANPFAPELTGESLGFVDPANFRPGSFCSLAPLENQAIQVWLTDAAGPLGRQQGVPGASEGAPVLATTTYENGRVAAIGGVDFIKTIDAPTKALFFEQLLRWLGENSPKRFELAGKGFAEVFPGVQRHGGHDYEIEFSRVGLVDRYRGRAPFIWPEHQEVVDGTTVVYNEATKKEARRIMEQAFPRVREALTEMYGRPTRGGKAHCVIHFFCNTSGGYSWNRPFTPEPIVGLPGLSDQPDISPTMYNTIQHEFTHAWGLPLGMSGHLLMLFNSIDLAEKLPETKQFLDDAWARRWDRLHAADPDLTRIDLAVVPDYRESPADRLRWAKWDWTFRQLRRKYGPGYFARVIALAEEDGYGPDEDVPTLVYYLCLAAEEDLYPWFAAHGTVVERKPLPERFPAARFDETE